MIDKERIVESMAEAIRNSLDPERKLSEGRPSMPFRFIHAAEAALSALAKELPEAGKETVSFNLRVDTNTGKCQVLDSSCTGKDNSRELYEEIKSWSNN